MKTFSFFVVAAMTVFAPSVRAQGEQIVFDTEHNATSIFGTWSTGSKAVKTGPGFANPANKSFTYPKNSGQSFSFSKDGFYEVARYRFNSNASEPNCIVGVVNWAHGHFELLSNGSILLYPLGDGYQQIQDPCAAVSNFVEDYNRTERMRNWRIFEDPNDGFKLHLFQFDGAPLPPMFRVSETPIMNPTRMLRNVTPPATDSTGATLLVNTNGASMVESSSLLVLGLAGILGLVALGV